MTPLLRACFFGNVEMVKALIQEKVDVNVVDSVRKIENLKNNKI